MRIRLLDVRNLKSVEAIQWEPNSGLNVLIGQNNAGKSTVLHALRVLQCLSGAPWPFSHRVSEISTDKNPNTPPSISLQVDFTQQDLSQCHSLFHTGRAHTLTFSFEIPMVTSNPKVSLTRASIEPKLPMTTREDLFWIEGDNYQIINSTGAPSAVYRRTYDLYEDIGRRLDDAGRWIGLDPLRLLLSEMFFYDPHRSVPTLVSVAGTGKLQPSGDNLARSLGDRLQEQDDRKAQLQELMQEINPGIGKLVVKREGDSQVWCGFQTDRTTINLAEMGTGLQQLVALGYQLVFREASVIAIEEPEVHLHPAAQRALNRAIRAAADQCQVLVVTHSPLFVDRRNYSSNWIVELNKQSKTSISTLGSNDPLRPVRNALGLTVGDALYSGEAIILVEGATEMVCLPKLSELADHGDKRAIEMDRVLFVNAGGAGNIHSMLRILNRFGVPVVVLLDRTNRANQIIQSCVKDGLTIHENVVFVETAEGGNAEFEDLLPLAKYLDGLLKETGVHVDPTEIATAQSEWAEEHNGHSASLPTILERILGKEFDKVEVALSTVEKLTPEEIPPFFSKLADKLVTVLS